MNAVYLVVFVLVIALFIWVLIPCSSVEGYGGPVKNIKHIPFNDCKRICEGYYQRCMEELGPDGAYACQRLYTEGCLPECYYSHSHRL